MTEPRIAKRVYQPIWVNGKESDYPYQRPSEERYEPIRELARRFKRPFSVLDIGSNYGYFDVRLMEEFDCTCVLIDNKDVLRVLKANRCLDRSVVFQRRVSAGVLEALSRCEHFDIVLGLSVLHHFSEPVRAYEAIRKLGWWSVFEIPGEHDIGAANPERHRVIRACFDKPDGYFRSHVSDCERPYFVLENEPYLVEQTLDAADRGAPGYYDFEIETSFESCELVKDGKRAPFVPGINLYSFQRLGGSWPQGEWISKELEKHRDHPDFAPWNFVLGQGLSPIDLEPKR